MPKSGKLSDLTAKYATSLAELYTKLLYKKDEIARELHWIESLIDGLEPVECALMRERYVNGLTWEAVCTTINYEWAQTHTIHGEILKKLTLE